MRSMQVSNLIVTSGFKVDDASRLEYAPATFADTFAEASVTGDASVAGGTGFFIG